MSIGFAIYQTKLGFIRINYENELVTLIKTTDPCFDKGIRTNFSDLVFSQIKEYLQGKRISFDFKYKFYGTDFQKKVWTELCRIPYGKTRTYKEIAKSIGNENASRAVGMANNKNPLMFVVPCHRVIGSSGQLVGYAGGIEMKKFLLNMEKPGLSPDFL